MKRKLIVIIVAFSVSFLFMVSLCLYSMGRFTTFSNYSGQVENTGHIVAAIRCAEIGVRDIGLSERGYMITRDSNYLSNMNIAIDSVNRCLEEIKGMIRDNQEQKRRLALAKAAVALRVAAAHSNIAYVDTVQGPAGSDYYDKSRSLMLECNTRLGAMADIESHLLSDRFKGQQFYGQLTDKTLKSLLTVFCIITLFLFLVLIREFRRRMIYQEELHQKVIELRQSHSELEEIAFVTSHDLQEPLRKIQVFSDLLQSHKAGGNDKTIEEISGRINHAASKGQSLVIALMNLTNLTRTDEPESDVDLNIIFGALLEEFAAVLAETDARIDLQPMPVIKGHSGQLRILFRSLLDNSLKFTNDGVTPLLSFSYEVVSGSEIAGITSSLKQMKFHLITLTDNGIGFDKQFATRIFRIFQRLHNQESQYEGKGIGLAICQRIMANHKGYIVADGTPGRGATFRLLFPM